MEYPIPSFGYLWPAIPKSWIHSCTCVTSVKSKNEKRKRGRKRAKNKLYSCQYSVAERSQCDDVTQTTTLTLTLKRGLPELCEQSKSLSRPCKASQGRTSHLLLLSSVSILIFKQKPFGFKCVYIFFFGSWLFFIIYYFYIFVYYIMLAFYLRVMCTPFSLNNDVNQWWSPLIIPFQKTRRIVSTVVLKWAIA